MINKKKRIVQFASELGFFALLLAADLISKSAVFAFLDTRPTHSFIVQEGIFTFYRVENYGMSFGLLSGQTGLLIGITCTVTALLVALVVLRPDTPKLFRISMWMIIAGAIGNVVDRIAFGYVRDFIDYTFLETFFGIDFAVGNIADLFVLLGMIPLLVYVVFLFEEKDFYSAKKRAALELRAKNALPAGVPPVDDAPESSGGDLTASQNSTASDLPAEKTAKDCDGQSASDAAVKDDAERAE